MLKRIWEYYEKHGRRLVFGIVAVGFAIAAVYEIVAKTGWWIAWVGLSVTFIILLITD